MHIAFSLYTLPDHATNMHRICINQPVRTSKTDDMNPYAAHLDQTA